MPEQIKSTTFDQVLPGKAHNLSHFFAVSGLVAMDMAMFTDRLFFKRATQSALERVEKKLLALCTDSKFFQGKPMKLNFVRSDDRLLLVMMSLAIH